MHSTDNTAIKTDGKCYVGIETNGSLVATRLYPAPPSTLNDYPVENQVYDLRMQVKLFCNQTISTFTSIAFSLFTKYLSLTYFTSNNIRN